MNPDDVGRGADAVERVGHGVLSALTAGDDPYRRDARRVDAGQHERRGAGRQHEDDVEIRGWARNAFRLCCSIVPPPMSSICFGLTDPTRRPDPAAAMMAVTCMGKH